jgi:hypothetical protein
VTCKLDFTKPMEAHDVVDYTLAPQGDGTKVTWAMRGPMRFVSQGMTLFFEMVNAVGGEFAKRPDSRLERSASVIVDSHEAG